ncbi:MAG: HEAT repeat domain-containing protein [Phycisphaerae bacterium]
MRLRGRAIECLSRATAYRPNPAVRVAAVEALESVLTGPPSLATPTCLPRIRAALLDEHPAVRFAGCVALGMVEDHVAEAALRERLTDDDASVQVAALFAMHRLGHTEQTGRMADYLLDHEDAAVRRNAAMVLGRLRAPGVVKLLARAMRDPDAGVRYHALEGMACHGNTEARQQLTFMANSGVGSEEANALLALGRARDAVCADIFRYKLATAQHLETRLAAVCGLGRLGVKEGSQLAVGALSFDKPRRSEPNDPPAAQMLRVRLLAATAAGATGDPAALRPLRDMLEHNTDPRLQVAAARAILEIIAADLRARSPLAASAG